MAEVLGDMEEATCKKCGKKFLRFTGPWEWNGLCGNCTYLRD